jgi:myosin heavy subunit
LGSDLIDLVCGSESTFLSSLFGPENKSPGVANGEHALERKRGTLKTKGGTKINGQETVGAQFKRQLSALMDTIESVCFVDFVSGFWWRAEFCLP